MEPFFGPCPVGLAGPGADTPVIAEGGKLGMEDGLPTLLALDQEAGVVCQDLLRDTVEILSAPDAGPAPRYVPSTERARTELGLTLKVGLDEALVRTLNWHRGNRTRE